MSSLSCPGRMLRGSLERHRTRPSSSSRSTRTSRSSSTTPPSSRSSPRRAAPMPESGAGYGDREPLPALTMDPAPSLRRAPAPGRVDRTVFIRPRRVNEKYLTCAAPSPADLQPPPSRRHRGEDPVRASEAEPHLNCRYPGSRRVVLAHASGGAALRDLARRLLRPCSPVSGSPGSYGFFLPRVHPEFHFVRSL